MCVCVFVYFCVLKQTLRYDVNPPEGRRLSSEIILSKIFLKAYHNSCMKVKLANKTVYVSKGEEHLQQ